MNANKFHIRRIMVALDGSPHSLAALEAAADLAALLQAELHGVFVEDINLLRLAQLPFAHEVRAHTATTEKLELAHMQRQLRLQAAQAQADLQRTAVERALAFTFRVAQGAVSAELLAAALEADLLALGRVGRQAQRQQLGSTARTAVSESARTILLMRPDVALHRPILTIYDGSPGAERALDVARYLAEENGRLRILIWATDKEQAASYQETITQQFADSDLAIEYRRLRSPDAANLAYLLRLAGPGLLILNDTDSTLPPETVHTLLEELDYPILLIR